MRSFLIASLFVLSAVASAEDVGILLGLGSPGGTGSTLWISQQGVATITQRAGQGYWLWREDGFWHIVSEDLRASGGRARVMVTDASGNVTVVTADDLNPQTDYWVTFVAPKVLGMGFHLEFGLGTKSIDPKDLEDLEKWIYRRRSIYRNVGWHELDREIDAGEYFDGQTMKKFYEMLNERTGSLATDPDSEMPPTNWTLTRDQGRWYLGGYYRLGPGDVGGAFPDDVPRAMSPDLGAHSGRRPTWSQITRKYPNAIDYATSPSGELTIIITPNETFIHKSNGRSLQQLLRKVTVTADRIVMTQWLEGDEVRKVAEAVTKIKR